jgi:glycosyltransferase involved in cell wall biosynthesis
MTRSQELSLVSVIIPTYNRSQMLRAALESVLAQTYPAIEVVVVDDGSTDDTAAMLEQYAGRICCVKQNNQGVERARNKGIRVSTGDYLSFLDDDDLMMPTKIERQVKVLDSQPEVGLVHCGYHYIDKDGNHLETTGRLPEGDVRKQLVWGCFPWSGGPLIRRECFDHIGKKEHRDWYGDWGMWLRIALAGYPFACIQEPLGYYRIVRGSMIDDKVANCERLVFSILDQVFANWQLPDDIVAEKNQIYGGWHFWISCRYYLGGYWDEAKRNLKATLTLRPELLQRPEDLLQLFYWDAVSPRVRVHDPIKFINDLFDHLPPIAKPIGQYRSRLLSQVYAGLAMRNYGAGRIAEARHQLSEAIALEPAMLDRPEAFVKSVYDYANRLPFGSPLAYVDTVFQNLPPQAQRLRHVRSRVLGEVNVVCAFQDYFAGHRRRVPRRVLAALRYHPPFIKNRGVISILVKSLLALSIKEPGIQ